MVASVTALHAMKLQLGTGPHPKNDKVEVSLHESLVDFFARRSMTFTPTLGSEGQNTEVVSPHTVFPLFNALNPAQSGPQSQPLPPTHGDSSPNFCVTCHRHFSF